MREAIVITRAPGEIRQCLENESPALGNPKVARIKLEAGFLRIHRRMKARLLSAKAYFS